MTKWFGSAFGAAIATCALASSSQMAVAYQLNVSGTFTPNIYQPGNHRSNGGMFSAAINAPDFSNSPDSVSGSVLFDFGNLGYYSGTSTIKYSSIPGGHGSPLQEIDIYSVTPTSPAFLRLDISYDFLVSTGQPSGSYDLSGFQMLGAAGYLSYGTESSGYENYDIVVSDIEQSGSAFLPAYVAPVPLPPGFSLYGVALLAIGGVAYARRRGDAVKPQQLPQG